MDTLRLFLAIPIPEDVRAELQTVQRHLQPFSPPRAVRWARPEQFHLTLAFLGNVPAGRTDALIQAVRPICAATSPLRLKANDVGFFPGASSPRVFWVAISDRDGLLPGLQRQLAAAVLPFAQNQEARPFASHVTLARLEKFDRRAAEKFVAGAKVFENKTFGEWTAAGVELVRSQLLPSGAQHEAIEVFNTREPS